MIAKKFIYAKPFEGEPKDENFLLVEEELGELKDNEILVEAEFLSVEPYMRFYMSRFEPGVTMVGGQVGKVIDSKNPNFPKGSHVFGPFGWRTLTIANPDEKNEIGNTEILPELGTLSRSLGIGYLGLIGSTAYFGFLEICQPKEGETVVVSAAAGAVGSLVGQIAKIKGCSVVGIAGSDEKCEFLINNLGFDQVINYKKGDFLKSLKEATPKGIDCYFDNVGGDLSSKIISQMNIFGRIAICGAISSYNLDHSSNVLSLPLDFLFKQLKMEGFTATRWDDRYKEATEQILKWIQKGKIKFPETITDGFGNMPKAFMGMLKGDNIGKAFVRV